MKDTSSHTHASDLRAAVCLPVLFACLLPWIQDRYGVESLAPPLYSCLEFLALTVGSKQQGPSGEQYDGN